jgi:hypothetical protein
MDIFYHCLIIDALYGEKPQIWILQHYVDYKIVQQELFLMLNMIYHLFNYLKNLVGCLFKNRLEYHKSVLMYKCINNSASDYLVNLFDMNTNSNVYSLRSSIKGNVFVPRLNSNLFITPELFYGILYLLT